MQGGSKLPPSGTPTLSGTLGAPSALPSGPVRDAGDLGKRGCKGGASSPLPEPPTLSGTLGAPSAQPSGPVRDAGDLGKINSDTRAKPLLRATLGTLSVHPRDGRGGGIR